MRYQRFSEDEWDDLGRSRPVTRDELDGLITQVEGYFATVRDRFQHQQTSDSDALILAASRACESVVRNLETRWSIDGTAVPKEASEQYYTRARSNAYTDLKREHNAKSNPWVASGDADVTDHVQAGERKGRVPVVSVASVPEDPETAALTRLSGTVVGAIVSRAVLVMAGRARKPQLTDTDLTILAFLLELDHGLLALREEEAKQAHVFTEEKTWRQELAAQLDGMNEKKLSAAVGTILARVRVALYLFAQLAPPHGSVDDPDEMDRLFDVAYIDGHGLDATARMLLHKAGVELGRTRRGWAVDTSSFVVAARELKRMRSETDEGVIARLHESEGEYSLAVPRQTNPPLFQCVLRCTPHSPLREG